MKITAWSDVKNGDRPPFGTILYIHEGKAWVRWDAPAYAGGICPLNALRRAE